MHDECELRREEVKVPWVLHMRWEDVLFLHWPVKAEDLRRCVPEEIALDTFEDKAWLGVVPFVMTCVRGRCLPRVPGANRFEELNVRTYVTVAGKPGVYFFSLDASNRLAVRAARLTFGLPYFDARMQCETDDEGWVRYQSRRTHRDAPEATFAGRYRGTGEGVIKEPGTLAHFLTERYALFVAGRKQRVRRSDVAHVPWALEQAEVNIERCRMTALLDMDLPDVAPIAYYAKGLDVRAAWPVVAD